MVQDIAIAQQQVAQAEVAVKGARQRLRAAKNEVFILWFRLLIARTGAAQWLAALIIGGVATVFISMPIALWLPVGPCFLLDIVAVGYGVFGGATFWLLRDCDGENDETRPRLRAEKFVTGKHRREATASALREAIAIAEQARQRLAQVEDVAKIEKARQLERQILAQLEDAARIEGARQQAAKAKETRQAQLLASMERQAAYQRMNQLLAVDPDLLSGIEFEEYIAEIFQSLGYATELTKKTGDQGVDIVAEKEGMRLAIQAKCWVASVGNSAVQEVVAGLRHYNCHRCIVVANSLFTPKAVELAFSNDCLLIGKNELGGLIRGAWTLQLTVVVPEVEAP